MKRQALLLSALLLLPASAQAADLGWNAGASPIYSPAPASGWTGFYAGVNAGYGFGTLIREPSAGGPETENDTGGFNFGGQAGYNMDMGGFVLGGEADLNWANIGYSQANPGGGTFTAKTDFYGTLRGRAGIELDVALDELDRAVRARRDRLGRRAREPVDDRPTGDEAEQEWRVKDRQVREKLGSESLCQTDDDREDHCRGANDGGTDQHGLRGRLERVARAVVLLEQHLRLLPRAVDRRRVADGAERGGERGEEIGRASCRERVSDTV